MTPLSPRHVIARLRSGDALVCEKSGGVTWSLLSDGAAIDASVVQALRDGLFLGGHLVPCGDALIAGDSQTWRWRADR